MSTLSNHSPEEVRQQVVIDLRTDDEILRVLASDGSQAPPTAKVVVLVPAHNEEAGIVKTIESLRQQTYPVHRILVMSDNSTDRTVELARAAGAEVHETVNNTEKKGGAMNQGFAMLLPTLEDHDFIMGMDADGMIKEDATEIAMEIFQTRPGLGGVSGSVRCRKPTKWLETAQVLEYEWGRRNMSRSGGKIHVLSGAAAWFPVHVLRHVMRARGTELPGTSAEVMLRGNIVEDYELTLAIRKLGYTVTSSKRVQMFSDLMPTIKMLEGQRMRWYRGTFETTQLYGWNEHTRNTFIAIAWNLFGSAIMALLYPLIAFAYLANGVQPAYWFLLLTPLFIAEYAVVSRTIPGWYAKLFACTFFPMLAYALLLSLIYWRAVWHALRKRPFNWHGDQEHYA